MMCENILRFLPVPIAGRPKRPRRVAEALDGAAGARQFRSAGRRLRIVANRVYDGGLENQKLDCGADAMTTRDIADDLVAMCKEGKFAESGEKYWADDVVSVEAGGPDGVDPVARGKEAVRGKGEWWTGAHEIHSVEVQGPYLNGDQFVVRFIMDVTNRQSGQKMHMDEQALYTIKDGMIVEERFFYGG
jgi:ketosteroid isomerase-like protein